MDTFPGPPIRTGFEDTRTPGSFSWGWTQWFLSVARVISKLAAAPTVTGSRGGNVALADLLTKLDAAGIVKDQTTI